MTPDHLTGAAALSQAAGWPHRREDWALLLGIGRGVAALDDGGRVAGTAMGVRFGPVAMANMIIVDEAMRGRGLGRRLMRAAMERVEGEGRPEWRLVATPEGMPLYRSLGFGETATVRQYQGAVGRVAGAENAARWLDAPAPRDLERIAAIDRAATAADRRSLLDALAASGRFAVLRDTGGQACGYGVLHPFGRGMTAGPIVARTAREAADLLVHMARDCAGGFLRVDTVSAPQASCPLAGAIAALGLPQAGEGTEMRRPAEGAPPPAVAAAGDFHRFALASQALG